MNRLPRILLFLTLLTIPAIAGGQQGPVEQLKNWLAADDRPDIKEQTWATQPLTKQDAVQAKELLWNDYVAQIKADRKEEWENKVIKLDDLEMKFEFKTFGEPDENGRRLFISMHGGGGAPARVNEKQWKNQIGLYEPEEGIYLAPRAPTDTWNLWHQAHIDKFFERMIQDAVVFEGVDPNRVYIMGYSAGGDGVYQLAPRMADHLAAAAMMAGHPNDASPLGLRNIGFTLHMGGDDGAYNRNKVAAEWKDKLAELQEGDPDGYCHEVVIHEGKGHWMDREDAVAIPWMAEFTRNTLPTRIVWRQSGVIHGQFYWLAVDDQHAEGGAEVVATRDGQNVTIERAAKVEKLTVRFSDEMLDLDQPVSVSINGQPASNAKLERNISTLYHTLQERGDPNLMFAAEKSLDLTK